MSIIFGNLYTEQIGQCRKIDGTFTGRDSSAKDLEECKIKCDDYPMCHSYDFFGTCTLYTDPDNYGNGKPGTTCYIKQLTNLQVTPPLLM